MPEAATPPPPRRIRDHSKGCKAPRCCLCCPLCDTASHNYRLPLQFLTIEAIRHQMGRPEGALTPCEIAAFYKMSLQLLICWSTAAVTPEDLLGAPQCSCPFVQWGTCGYPGFEVSLATPGLKCPPSARRKMCRLSICTAPAATRATSGSACSHTWPCERLQPEASRPRSRGGRLKARGC